MVKCTGRGLVVKRPGVLSKVLMLNLVLGVGVFSLLPINLGFGEPMFCTLGSRGFRHCRAFRYFLESSNRPPCLWLSELSSSFGDFRRFREKHRNAKHRFGKT